MIEYNSIESQMTIVVDKELRSLLYQKYKEYAGEKMVVLDKGTRRTALVKTEIKRTVYDKETGELISTSEESYDEIIPPKPLLLIGEKNRLRKATLTWDEIESFKYYEPVNRPAQKSTSKDKSVKIDLNGLTQEQLKTLRELKLI